MSRKRVAIIIDDGTPLCLPSWARDEIVRLRLENIDLKIAMAETRVDLRVAQGMDPFAAISAEMID